MPVYVPVAMSFLMPFHGATISMLSKHVVHTRKMDCNDFSFTYIICSNIVLFTGSLFYFAKHELIKKLYIMGFFGCVLEAVGCTSLNNALVVAPAGPVLALLNMQCLILTVLVAIKDLELPHFL